jgi:Domain of unknown function (DUF1995)
MQPAPLFVCVQQVVAFREEAQAQAARYLWGIGSTYKGTVQALGSPAPKKKASSSKRSKSVGFAKKMSDAIAEPVSVTSIIPRGTEVLIVVGPTSKELTIVEQLSEKLGMATLIILLNARLDELTESQHSSLAQTYEGVFHLKPVAEGDANRFLYRAYPNDWTVSVKPKIGPPKALKQYTTRPTPAEVQEAIAAEPVDTGILGNLF